MSIPSKTCKKCGETKPISEFFKIAKDEKAAKQILANSQRRYLMLDNGAVLTMLNKHKKYTLDIPKELIEAKRIQVQIKRACKPPIVKPVEEFVFDLNSPSSYRTYCKECCKSDARELDKKRIERNKKKHNDLYYASLSGIKKCTTCGAFKDVKDFNKNRSLKDGLDKSCADCKASKHVNRKRRYQRLNKDEYRAHDGMKKCRTCSTVKSISEYTKSKNRRALDSLNSECNACKNARLSIWANNNREHTRTYANNRRQSLSPERKEALLNKIRAYGQQERDNLTDAYIKKLLEVRKGVEIPQELIEAKRLQVQLRRMTDENSNKT